MPSFAELCEEQAGRVTETAALAATAEDLLRTARHAARERHSAGHCGLSKRRLASVTKDECVATREEGTKTFQG